MKREDYLLDILFAQSDLIRNINKLDPPNKYIDLVKYANSVVAIMELLGSDGTVPLYWADINLVNQFKGEIENNWKLNEIEDGAFEEVT